MLDPEQQNRANLPRFVCSLVSGWWCLLLAPIRGNSSQPAASCPIIALELRVIIFPPSLLLTPLHPPPHPPSYLFLLPFHVILPPFLLNMTDSPGRDQLLPRRLEAQKSVLAPRLPSAPLLHLPKRGQENVASSIPLCQRGCIRTGWQARVGLIKTEAGGPNIGTAQSLPGRTGKPKQSKQPSRWANKEANKQTNKEPTNKQKANKQTNRAGRAKQSKQADLVTGQYQFPTW